MRLTTRSRSPGTGRLVGPVASSGPMPPRSFRLQQLLNGDRAKFLKAVAILTDDQRFAKAREMRTATRYRPFGGTVLTICVAPQPSSPRRGRPVQPDADRAQRHEQR